MIEKCRLMALVIAVMSLIACFEGELSAQTNATRPALCGSVNTLKAIALSDAPFQFAFDSDSKVVYLLPSPDGRYIVVLRHCAGDSSYIGIWDKEMKKAYGNETVTLGYAVSGVCWDPKKPLVYFVSEDGSDQLTNGIFKWDFLKNPDDAVRIDKPKAIKKAFKRDSVYMKLVDIDADSAGLIVNVSAAIDSNDMEDKSRIEINKKFTYKPVDGSYVPLLN